MASSTLPAHVMGRICATSLFSKVFAGKCTGNCIRNICLVRNAAPLFGNNESKKHHGIYTQHIRRNADSTYEKKRDFYEVLGLKKNATSDEIKKAYHTLSKKYHPDICKDEKSRKNFREVSEAYQVLSDNKSRRNYDAMGSEGFGSYSSGGGGGGGFGYGYGHQGTRVDPEELFRNIFGDAAFKNAGFGGFGDYAESNFGFAPASEVMMNLTFKEAVTGCNKHVSINVSDICPKCDGNKSEPGTKKVRCHYCNGTGMETFNKGPFVMQSTCRHCFGSKVLIQKPCTECAGAGKTIQRKSVTVPVPAGVEDGQTVRMSVSNKEIFITFKVEKSRQFRRDGADIHSDVNLSLSQAVLGGIVNVKGIYEDVNLRIPAGTSSSEKIKISGKGVPRSHSYGHGDHYVHVQIKVPRSLTPQQKALIQAFAELETNVDGSVDGVRKTETGKVAIDDKDGLVEQLRSILGISEEKKQGQN